MQIIHSDTSLVKIAVAHVVRGRRDSGKVLVCGHGVNRMLLVYQAPYYPSICHVQSNFNSLGGHAWIVVHELQQW